MAKAFFAVLKVTGAEKKGYMEWLNSMVAVAQGATPEHLTDMAAALQNFCAVAKDFTPDRVKDLVQELGKKFAPLFEKTTLVVSKCIPDLVDGMAKLLEKQLLSSQAFFQEKVQNGSGKILPNQEEVPAKWFADCVHFCNHSQATNLKDSLVTMVGILQLESGMAFEELYNKHFVQYHCCICMASILEVPKEWTVADLKACVVTVQLSLAKLAPMVDDSCKAWVSKNVVSYLFGSLMSNLMGKLGEAISAQPDNLHDMIVSRSSQRLRQVCFSKATHEVCVGELDNFSAIYKTLEELPMDQFLSQKHCGQVKTMAGSLARIKTYAFSVHGLNLLFHRFPSKSRMERTALVRECLGVVIVFVGFIFNRPLVYFFRNDQTLSKFLALRPA